MKLSDPGATAIIGAVSVLAGVLLSSVVTLWIERRRHKWEDRRRWDDPRRQAYGDFLHTAGRAWRAQIRLGEFFIAAREQLEALDRALVEGGEAPDDTEVNLRFESSQAQTKNPEDWHERSNRATTEIVIVGSKPVREAAKTHFHAYRALALLLEKEEMPTVKVQEWLDEYARRRDETRDALEAAIRVELGVEQPRRFWYRRKAETT